MFPALGDRSSGGSCFFGGYRTHASGLDAGHGSGANRTSARRVGVAMNYCAGYVRQQENQQLGIPREVVQRFAPRLRELVGYGVYNGLIGHIDKRSPAKLLGDDGGQRMVWEY